MWQSRDSSGHDISSSWAWLYANWFIIILNDTFVFSNMRKPILLKRQEFLIPCTYLLTWFTSSGRLVNKGIPAWDSSSTINLSDGKRWVVVKILYLIFSLDLISSYIHCMQWIQPNNHDWSKVPAFTTTWSDRQNWIIFYSGVPRLLET